jgi:hypothetical protein
MEYVTEDIFVQLLNDELVRDPKGAYLRPFILGNKGYDWPHDTTANDIIYRRVANIVREKYGIYH